MSFILCHLPIYPTDVISEKENYLIERDLPKETGYTGDDDTSSNESPEPHNSDSEDDISRTSRKGNILQLDPSSQCFLYAFRLKFFLLSCLRHCWSFYFCHCAELGMSSSWRNRVIYISIVRIADMT